MSARDADRFRAKRSAALDVGWRVADHDQALARDVEAECFAGTSPRDRRQLGTVLVVGSERVDLESVGVDSGSGQLDARPGLDIASKQTEDHVLPRLERIENLGHTLEWSDVEPPTLRLRAGLRD